MGQFGLLNEMQQEIDAAHPPVRVHLLGVNGMGLEAGNEVMTDGRDIPWLQDTAAVKAWVKWNVTFRDVVILDAHNRVIGVYNLTEHDLQVPSNYFELRGMLLDAAGA